LTILAVLNARLALLRIVETTLLQIAARLAAANRRNCSASMHVDASRRAELLCVDARRRVAQSCREQAEPRKARCSALR